MRSAYSALFPAGDYSVGGGMERFSAHHMAHFAAMFIAAWKIGIIKWHMLCVELITKR